MSVDVEGPQRPETMTRRQLERRRRLLDAVHELLRTVPAHDIQVKDVAGQAGVSLAAIYHYFSSKDHLLAEALVDWAGGLGETAGRRAPPGPLSERFTVLVRGGVRAYRHSPQYAELFLLTAASRDPHAIDCMGQLAELVGGAMREALSELDDTTAQDVQRIVGNAWTGGLFECVHGLSTFPELERSMTAACRMLLEPLDPRAADAPRPRLTSR